MEDLEHVFEALGSDDKKFVLAARSQGFSTDYGHVDLILGKRARDEIYPNIAEWIEAHG